MASSILNRIENGDANSSASRECLSICLIGGIYGKNEEYRAKVKITPETTLESGLRIRGHNVITHGHRYPLNCHGMDIVHVHHLGYGALRAAASSSDTPFVYTSHDPYPLAGLLSRSHRAATKFVMSRTDAVVALSQCEIEFQRKAYPLAGAIHKVIPNGISTESYQYLRNNSAGKGEAWKLLFVGQLIDLKGVDFLLQALTLLPQNIKLQLVFNVDTIRSRLEHLAHELGLQQRVFFVGAKSPNELKPLYQQADLFVLPSLGEALPSVVTEAMLCGTPVVATDVGGIRDQLGGYGMVVPPRDATSLARAIGHVLSHYAEFKGSGEAMSHYAAKRFSIHAMVESHLELYRSLLRRRAARRNRVFCRPMNIATNLGVRLLCKI
jgi:glycosyltransferase involved in cell wall biosynthesis